jgi:hypothetical protein
VSVSGLFVKTPLLRPAMVGAEDAETAYEDRHLGSRERRQLRLIDEERFSAGTGYWASWNLRNPYTSGSSTPEDAMSVCSESPRPASRAAQYPSGSVR